MQINSQGNRHLKTIKSLAINSLTTVGLTIIGTNSLANDLDMTGELADRYLSVGGEIGYRSIVRDEDRLLEVDDYHEYGGTIEAKFSNLYSMYVSVTDAEPELNGSGDGIEYERYSFMLRRFSQEHSNNPGCCWRPFIGIGYSYSDVDYIDTENARSLSDESALAILGVGVHRRLGNYLLVETGIRLGIDLDNTTTEINPFVGLKAVLPIFQSNKAIMNIQSAGYQLQVPDAAPTESIEVLPVEPVELQVSENNLIDRDEDGVIDSLDQCLLTPFGALVDDKGCAKILKRPIRQDLELLFESNKTKIDATSFIEIKRISDVMKEFPTTRVTIIGHTDSVGDSEFNRILSLGRASSVKDVLINEFGISSNRIDIIGRGESEPKYENTTAENRRLNRRIEAVVETSYSVMQMRER